MKRKDLVLFAAFLLGCQAKHPLALHQLVEVESGGEVVLLLHGVDFEGDDVSNIRLCVIVYQFNYILEKFFSVNELSIDS